MHRTLERQLRRLGVGEGPPTAEQWRQFLERVDCAYTEADQDRYTLERALDLSSTEMRRRFEELRAAQTQLITASRKAGMADVATSVLHNVGNVLNSVNVSASVVVNLAKSSARDGLGKSLALLNAQPAPGRFLDEDPRGKKLLAYLAGVDKALGDERTSMQTELGELTRHVEHIKAIVSQQLAVVRGEKVEQQIAERFNLSELVEDALSVLRQSLPKSQDVVLVRELDSIAIEADRHKLFQIVVNLLANARDAVQERSGVITVQTMRVGKGQVGLVVKDNGVGIAAEIQDQIFKHGFTTKRNGHGFGLHSSACAAVELGGALSADSGGAGKGASFRLVLPVSRSSTKQAPPAVAASPLGAST